MTFPPHLSRAVILMGTAWVVPAQTRIPVEISGNLVMTKVSINGGEPELFVVDSAASNSVIDSRLAERLRLQRGKGVNASVQGGDVQAQLLHGIRLFAGQAAVPPADIAVLPLAGLQAATGRKVSGILGKNLFDAWVVEFGLEDRTLILHNPKTFRYTGDGSVLPAVFQDGCPVIRAVLRVSDRSLDARLCIDTGASGALTLNTPFVKRNRLLTATGKTIATTTAVLHGAASRTGRIETLTMGRVAFASPIVNFSQDEAGDDASAETDGRVGQEVLRRTHLIVDMRRRRVILEPTSQVSEPFEFDMSGASLRARDGSIVVRAVLPDSPASNSGLQLGDEIIAINGQRVTDADLDRVREDFRQPGKTWSLELKNSGESRTLPLTTRRLI